jgi:hypothetical protein
LWLCFDFHVRLQGHYWRNRGLGLRFGVAPEEFYNKTHPKTNNGTDPRTLGSLNQRTD